MKDCRWDYESYSCNYCTKRSYDADVGYHVIKPSNEDDWTFWEQFYRDRGDSATWDDLQISLCGVFPQSANSGRVPKDRDQCNKFQVFLSIEI